MSVRSLVKQVFIEQENKRYRRKLAESCMTYDSWIREKEKEQALQYSDWSTENSDFVYFVRPGVTLAKDAVSRIAGYFEKYPQIQMIYGDEDVQDIYGERSCPWFKPDWSPDLLDCYFYFGSLVALRKSLWDRKKEECEYLNQVYECAVLAGGYQKGCKAICHIPEILCHCESKEQMEAYLTRAVAEKYVKKDDGRLLEAWASKCRERKEALISIVIPSKDQPEILEKCLKAIPGAALRLPYEIILVDNGSREANRKAVERMTEQFSRAEDAGDCVGIRYIYQPMEFHFSKMCNLGAEAASGELLLFLNDDVEFCGEGSICKMAELAIRDYTGAVGMKLYYPGSVRLQHAGITNLPMGPVHKLQFLEDDRSYYFGANRGLKNTLAVTAACLMVSKDKFEEVGGFSEALRVAFNDVDFCYALYEKGYYNVCRNDCYAYHHESLSRGDDESTEKWKRLQEERAVLYERHPGLEGVDPYYGAGLGREGLDTRIRPAFETAANQMQKAEFKLWKEEEGNFRQDKCLMVRVENCRQGVLQGYGVVLGDNNACYEKELLLKDLETNQIYSLKFTPQYRPDLVENMPDQVNVGLCGFWVQPVIKGKQYSVGMAARNRVTGLRLIQFSSRILTMDLE